MKIELENGKYELVFNEENSELFAKRNGNLWRDFTYDKFMYLLLAKITELQQENENVRLANLDCVENFNALMKDYTDLQKELIEIEEREYKNKLIESR